MIKHFNPFIKFDIINLYKSITKNISTKALELTRNFYSITDKDVKLIILFCKAIDRHNNQTLEK